MGCVLVNGFGIGVEVVYVMVYGGLYLFIVDGCLMLVGSFVICCFLWLVSY